MPPLSIRALGRRLNAAPVQEDSARARGLHPRQFAPGGGELRSRLYEPLAHVRGGGYLPGKHAAWQRRTIRALGSWSPVGTVQDRPSRQARRSLSLVLIEPLAHVRGPVPGLSIRGGCTPGNSRLGAVSCAHVCTNRWRTCAAQCLGCQFALWAARFARAHRATSARARRGYLPGGAAGGIKQKEKRPWQTPLAFSL